MASTSWFEAEDSGGANKVKQGCTPCQYYPILGSKKGIYHEEYTPMTPPFSAI